MNENDIVGGAALLLLMLVVWFFSTPVGMILLGVLIAAAVAATAYDSYSSHEPWETYDPPLRKGSKHLLAKGRMSGGRFCLYREYVDPRQGCYPAILTLVRHDRQGNITSAVARLVRSMDDNGRVTIGRYRGRDVIIDVDTTIGAFPIDLTNPYDHNRWQVFPPAQDLPSWLKPLSDTALQKELS